MKIKVFTARGSKGLQVRLARISGGAVGAAARARAQRMGFRTPQTPKQMKRWGVRGQVPPRGPTFQPGGEGGQGARSLGHLESHRQRPGDIQVSFPPCKFLCNGLEGVY